MHRFAENDVLCKAYGNMACAYVNQNIQNCMFWQITIIMAEQIKGN